MEFLTALFIISAGLSLFALFTNPFSKVSVVALPFIARFRNDKLIIQNNNHLLRIRQNALWRVLAIIKCGVHIMGTRYMHSPRSRAKTVAGVIRDIHHLRYNPRKLLLISGDHFSALFVRNLGVFLYPVLDTSFGISEKDWQRRQTVYLQTVAYAVGVFAKHNTLTTTIVPTNRYGATCVNFYAYPSDTLYGILYALAALSGRESARPFDYGKPVYELTTQEASTKLLDEHKASLTGHYERYRQYVFNEKVGLIKKTVHLSGAKDITRRTGAFYDNVVFWKTTQLAMKLGFIPWDQHFLDKLKTDILKTYWLAEKGYFLEDQSDEGIAEGYYSSDWLIVLVTGFLDPQNPKERTYFMRSVTHIQAEGIDQPFAIKYHNKTRASRQFLPVRIAVASYGGDAIWSFWGMEYVKTLLILARTSKNKPERDRHLAVADKHIASYKAAMLRYGGFPEVYDNKGNLLTTRMYQSICQTSWVIGFEQVLAMREKA